MPRVHNKLPKAPKGSIGHRLWEARTKADLTQEQLAEKSGVGQSAISLIENGSSRHIRAETLVRLAGALELTARYLQDGITDRGPMTDEASLRAVWSQLSPKERIAWVSYGEFLLSQSSRGKKATG